MDFQEKTRTVILLHLYFLLPIDDDRWDGLIIFIPTYVCTNKPQTPPKVAQARAFCAGEVGARRLQPTDVGVSNDVRYGIKTNKLETVCIV